MHVPIVLCPEHVEDERLAAFVRGLESPPVKALQALQGNPDRITQARRGVGHPPPLAGMSDPQGREYGRVEIRRVTNGTDTRYKALWSGEVIGWATTLREACERVHGAYLAAHWPNGRPMADWGDGWREGAIQQSDLPLGSS